MKKNFQVDIPKDAYTTPFIFRTEEPGTGLAWRDAKKALRNWYLEQARNLRTYSEKAFKKEEDDSLASETKSEAVKNVVEAGAALSSPVAQAA